MVMMIRSVTPATIVAVQVTVSIVVLFGARYNYYKQHPDQPYCQLVIAPKIDKLHEKFKDKLKTP
jgi:hypothetical protein